MNVFRHIVTALLPAACSLALWGAEANPPGIRNFHQVNDRVFRGAQPTGEAWKGLADMGVKVVIDLREGGEDRSHSLQAEARAVKAAGMRFISVPMSGIAGPRDEQISKVLSVLDSKEPVFVHCRAGRDRTGTVIACYRIAHDHWPNQRALDEAKSYGMHWFEEPMRRYILGFQPAPQKSLPNAGSETVAAGP